MNEKPTAVISGASLGALRRGRYATRSIIVLSVPQRDHREHERQQQAEEQPGAAGRGRQPERAEEPERRRSVPIMNTSPWAKLISSMMP